MRFILIVGLTLSLLTGAACTPPPPTLSPVAQVAFRTTQVIKALDMIRDTAIAANNTTPPVMTERTTGTVVTWHRSTLIVVNAAQQGWQAATLVSLQQLENQLSGTERSTLVPYITLARTILAEVVR